MESLSHLQHALQTIAGFTNEDFDLSKSYWQEKEYKKGEYYNEYRNVCKYLGFITEGVFRSYYIDVKSEEEKNVFFFSQDQIVVSYQSFVTQTPCNYYTQAMTDAKVIYIHIDHLTKLYHQSLEDQKKAYEENTIPESKTVARGSLTSAAKVDYEKPHAPLLITSGDIDTIIPAHLNYRNYKKYKQNGSVLDYKEFKGRNHFVVGLPTWKEDADYILEWINKN